MTDWMRDPVRREGAAMFADHPTSEQLVLYVDAVDDLSATELKSLESHFELCSSCEDDVSRLRAVAARASTLPESAQPRESFTKRLAGWMFGPEVLPALAVAGVAILWFGVLAPQDEDPLALSVGRAVVLRPETERGPATVAQRDEVGRLSLLFQLPPAGEASAVDLRLLDATGQEIARVDAAEALDEFGTYVLVLEAKDFEMGAYTLVAVDAAGEREFGFQLR